MQAQRAAEGAGGKYQEATGGESRDGKTGGREKGHIIGGTQTEARTEKKTTIKDARNRRQIDNGTERRNRKIEQGERNSKENSTSKVACLKEGRRPKEENA